MRPMGKQYLNMFQTLNKVQKKKKSETCTLSHCTSLKTIKSISLRSKLLRKKKRLLKEFSQFLI